jgi:hypothetical protein
MAADPIPAGFLVDWGSTAILLDCGQGVVRNLQRLLDPGLFEDFPEPSLGGQTRKRCTLPAESAPIGPGTFSRLTTEADASWPHVRPQAVFGGDALRQATNLRVSPESRLGMVVAV